MQTVKEDEQRDILLCRFFSYREKNDQLVLFPLLVRRVTFKLERKGNRLT